MAAKNAAGADRANDRPRQDQTTKNNVDSAAHIAEAQAEFWAARVLAAHTSSVIAIIETGFELMAAKAKLAHGEWGRLTGETTGQALLPFGPRTAQMLIQIAQHPTLSNPKHCCGFPASWTTLAMLAKLPAEAVEERIADGAINVEMTRADAEEMVETWRSIQAPPPAPSPPPAPPPPSPPDPEAVRAAHERHKAAEEAARRAFKAAAEEASRQAYKKASQRARSEEAAARTHPVLMSVAEFKLVLGCLHPDHQPADRQTKYTKAFQLFKALEHRLVSRGAL